MHLTRILSILAVMAATAGPLAAAVSAQTLYGYRDARGSVTFTNRRPEGKTFWVVEPRAPARSVVIRQQGFRGGGFRPTASRYDSLIMETARAYRLEPALMKAVIHAESSFNPQARSPKGARGLMQVMPATGRRFGVENLYSPSDNVVAGARYLRWLYDHFNGNIVFVLAGYNAGEGAVRRYNGVPPFAETQTYVRRVLTLRDQYRCDYTGKKGC